MSQLVRLQLTGIKSSEPLSVQLTVSGEQSQEGSVAAKLLPPKSVIDDYQTWQYAYKSLINPDARKGRAITVEAIEEYDSFSGSYDNNIQHCLQLSTKFLKTFNEWLCSPEFIKVREAIHDTFRIQPDLKSGMNGQSNDEYEPEAQVRFVICTDNHQLQQLPWTKWDLLIDYPQIEVAISSQSYRTAKLQQSQQFPISKSQVRVLAILGDSTNINVEADQELLERLPSAEVEFMATPQRGALHEELWEKPRDILFFAGHSFSQGDKGSLRINADEELSIDQIQNALTRMVRHGLTLAIFNSCDGLGLARTLADLQIPYIIVMREEVPDQVAQTFLKFFLHHFSSGVSFHRSVREARERLEQLHGELPPYGDWMPVIWQNPLVSPPVWPQPRPATAWWPPTIRQLCTGAAIVLGTTLSIVGLRWTGILQGPELNTYSQWMRMQPTEEVDPHILLVKIPEDDLNREGAVIKSISDPDLERLFQILESSKPAIIGLDIFRDFPVEPGRKQLVKYLSDPSTVVTICGADGPGKDEIGPSPEADPNKTGYGVGFSDVVPDYDGVYRRHLLGMGNSVGDCKADQALSTLLTQVFLDQKGLIVDLNSFSGTWEWGKARIPLLKPRQGPYHHRKDVLKDLEGDQMLLRYRNPPDVTQAFKSVTLNQVLSNQVDPALIRDRIIIIGTDATSIQDPKPTPFFDSAGRRLIIPGIEYQAHLTSQLVHLGLGDRSMLRPMNFWADTVWIGFFACVGVLVGWCWWRQPTKTALASGTAILALYGVGWASFTGLSLLVSFVPSALTLSVACGLYNWIGKEASTSLSSNLGK